MVVPHVNRVFGQKFTRNAKNCFECPEMELLQCLTPNLYGFDRGLEAGSR